MPKIEIHFKQTSTISRVDILKYKLKFKILLWQLFTFSTIVLVSLNSSSATDIFSIIDIRRNIPLADSDPIYKDFYINVGANSGLSKNRLVTVVRKVLIKDSTGAQSFGEIDIPVGILKIIAIYKQIAVARESKLISRDSAPLLEQIGIMVGDQIDLNNPSEISEPRPNSFRKKNAPAKVLLKK